MRQYKEELTPVKYGPAKIHHHISRFKQPYLNAHWHDQMELIRLRQGEMTVGCENIAVLRPGDVYIIPPKTPHYIVCCDKEAAYDVLMFDIRAFYNDTELCHSYLEPLFDGRAKFRLCIHNREITKCLDRVVALSETHDFEIFAVMYKLLDLLFRHALVEIGADIKGRHIINQATDYMKANLTEKLTTKELAKLFGYSEEHFCRLFKEVTQFTPMQYLKIFRLERAMQLLNEGKYTVNQIAVLCGFSDPNYFSRCFKNFFGMTPSQMQQPNTQ